MKRKMKFQLSFTIYYHHAFISSRLPALRLSLFGSKSNFAVFMVQRFIACRPYGATEMIKSGTIFINQPTFLYQLDEWLSVRNNKAHANHNLPPTT